MVGPQNMCHLAEDVDHVKKDVFFTVSSNSVEAAAVQLMESRV